MRPLVLDLNGDHQISVTRKDQGQGVLIDVDDDGYAEESDWIGPREGILVADFDGNGKIQGGHEMFSDSRVNLGARGLHALDALDANGDGLISSGDAAYSHVQAWQDINQDGVAQATELRTLSQLGISSLNINTGSLRARNTYKTATFQ